LNAAAARFNTAAALRRAAPGAAPASAALASGSSSRSSSSVTSLRLIDGGAHAGRLARGGGSPTARTSAIVGKA